MCLCASRSNRDFWKELQFCWSRICIPAAPVFPVRMKCFFAQLPKAVQHTYSSTCKWCPLPGRKSRKMRHHLFSCCITSSGQSARTLFAVIPHHVDSPKYKPRGAPLIPIHPSFQLQHIALYICCIYAQRSSTSRFLFLSWHSKGGEEAVGPSLIYRTSKHEYISVSGVPVCPKGNPANGL